MKSNEKGKMKRFQLKKSDEVANPTRMDMLNYLKSKVDKLFSDFKWNKESPSRKHKFDEEIDAFEKKVSKEILIMQTKELFKNTTEIKTWGKIYEIVELLGYANDEYVRVENMETIIATYDNDDSSVFNGYFVKCEEGNSEGYYVDVFPIYSEKTNEHGRSSRNVLKNSTLTGKFWDEDRAIDFANFLRSLLRSLNG